MCNECCKEFKGWRKSFTRTETLLTILESILLVLCVAFLVFLILHLVACSFKLKPVEERSDRGVSVITERIGFTTTFGFITTERAGGDQNKSYTKSEQSKSRIVHTTLRSDVECTWVPSNKTAAPTRYYERGISPTAEATRIPTTSTVSLTPNQQTEPGPALFNDIDDLAFEDQSDGETAEEMYSRLVLALVKVTPPRDITFGCILTAISERWTLTAASCIEAIEEVDSVDSFVMMEGYGGAARAGGMRTHAVGAVMVHPRYGGADPAHDLAALRSEGRLRVAPARLPSALDYLLITIGERLTLLGFGGFRSIRAGPAGRGPREVRVYTLPARQCLAEAGAGDAGWALRHLSRGAALARASCGAAPLCAGALYARGAACNYCAGAPLVRAWRGGGAPALLGVQAGGAQCGVACEPALYVNLALVRDWIDALLDPNN